MERTCSHPGRRRFLRLTLGTAAGAGFASLLAFGDADAPPTLSSMGDLSKYEWGYLVDTTVCIGCGSCVRACEQENDVPDHYFRTWVERYEIDRSEHVHVDSPDGALNSFAHDMDLSAPPAKGFFVPKICNHCRNSACTQVCPIGATFHTPDGVVLIDKKRCMGCGYCVQACPYGCRYIDPREHKHTADKCTLC